MPTATPYLAKLQKALNLAERIEALEHELAGIMGEDGASALKAEVQPAAPKATKGKGRKPISAESKARMAAGQKARWAKKNGGSVVAPTAAKAGKKKRTMSPEAKARIGAAMKARWAAKKKDGRASNARKGK